MATDDTRHNPYEDADPIRMLPHGRHKTQSSDRLSTSQRSRLVQSARDASREQERTARADDAPQTDPTSDQPKITHKKVGSASVRAPRPADRGSRRTAARNDDFHQPGGHIPLSAAGTRSRVRQAPRPYGMRTRRKMGFGILASIIIFAIVVLAWLLYWINRPVPITVNGEAAEVRVGSTLAEVLHELRIEVTPGNYVSVTDAVLEPSSGYEFTAAVNGTQLSPQEASDYRIAGSEAVDFTDGQDIIEEYEAQEETILPYLRMDGSGYAIQYISQWGYAGTMEHRTGKVSGTQADVITKEPQDCVITCRDLFLEGDTKYVALTFDDGPSSPYTEQYLEILDRYGVKATFFNLGDNITQLPQIAQLVVSKGHQVANHTMAHNQLTAVDEQTVFDQITTSAAAIEQATGIRTTHIRPPYGDFTERSWLGSRGSITASIRWTGDSRDWELPGAAAIVDNALLNVHSGSILLMHDGGGDRAQDVEALPMLIERLQAEGYQFVTVSDLMRAAGDIPEEVCSGTGGMPEGAIWPAEIHPDDIAAAATA